MTLVLFGVFAVVFAMGFNYFMPKLSQYVSGNQSLAQYQSSYVGQTLITAVLIFGLLLVLGFVLSKSGERVSAPGVSVG